MKTPINMLEDISGQLTENISLLEFIVRESPDMHETDNALACLIRSMLKTMEQAQEYIDAYNPPQTDKMEVKK